MNEKIIRVLSATDFRAAQNCVAWSYARQAYISSAGAFHACFHVALDGCYEARTGDVVQNGTGSAASRALNRYSQGTQTARTAVLQATLSPAAAETATTQGQVSRAVLFDLYRAHASRSAAAGAVTGAATGADAEATAGSAQNCAEDDMAGALRTAERLQALCVGEDVVLRYCAPEVDAPFARLLYTLNGTAQPITALALHPQRGEVFCVCYAGVQQAGPHCDIFALGDITAPAQSLLLPADSTAVAWAPDAAAANGLGPINNMANSSVFAEPATQLIVFGMRTGQIVLCDAATGQIVQTASAHDDFVTAVHFARKDTVISTAFDGTHCQFSIAGAQIKFEVMEQLYAAPASQPYEQRALKALNAQKSADSVDQHTWETWNVRSAAEWRVWANGAVNAQFAVNNSDLRPFRTTAARGSRDRLTPYLLVAGAEDGAVRLLSASLGFGTLRACDGHSLAVYTADFNRADEHVFATAGEDGAVLVWHSDVLQPLLRIAFKSAPIYVAFSPMRATELLVVTHNGDIALFNLLAPERPRLSASAEMPDAAFAAVNDKFKMLLIASESGAVSVFQLCVGEVGGAAENTPAQTGAEELAQFLAKYGIS